MNNNRIYDICDITNLEAMLIILLDATSVRQPSFTHIILDFFRLETMRVESVISPVAFNLFYPEVKDLNSEDIIKLINQKLNF